MIGLLRDSLSSVRRITWSTINKWRSCKRRWYYRYVGRFGPPRGLALLQGSLFHSLMDDEAKRNMEIQAQGKAIEDREIAMRKNSIGPYIFVRMGEVQHLFDQYKDDALAPFRSAEDQFLAQLPTYTEQEVEDSVDLLKGMFINWLELRGALDLEQYEFIGSEISLGNQRIPTPNGKLLRGWRVSGIIDQLLRDKNTGKLILREIKTTSSPASTYHKRVDLDPQVRLYAHMLELSGMVSEPIDQVQYVVFRKALTKPPKLVSCPICGGKTHGEKSKKTNVSDCQYCNQTGKVPSTDKRLDSTKDRVLANLETLGFATRGIYVDWDMVECDNQEWWVDPRYSDLVQSLNGWEKFICLTSHYLGEQDKSEALWEAYEAAVSIRDATRRYNNGESYWISFPRNTDKCSSPSGYCEYKEICQMRLPVEDFAPSGNWETNLPDNPEIVELEVKLEEQENE